MVSSIGDKDQLLFFFISFKILSTMLYTEKVPGAYFLHWTGNKYMKSIVLDYHTPLFITLLFHFMKKKIEATKARISKLPATKQTKFLYICIHSFILPFFSLRSISPPKLWIAASLVFSGILSHWLISCIYNLSASSTEYIHFLPLKVPTITLFL